MSPQRRRERSPRRSPARNASTSEILAALQRSPAAANALDGLGITPVETAAMIQTKLTRSGHAALAQEIQSGLDALDPSKREGSRPARRTVRAAAQVSLRKNRPARAGRAGASRR